MKLKTNVNIMCYNVHTHYHSKAWGQFFPKVMVLFSKDALFKIVTVNVTK